MKDSKIFKSKCAPWFNAVQVRNFSTLKNRHAEKVSRTRQSALRLSIRSAWSSQGTPSLRAPALSTAGRAPEYIDHDLALLQVGQVSCLIPLPRVPMRVTTSLTRHHVNHPQHHPLPTPLRAPHQPHQNHHQTPSTDWVENQLLRILHQNCHESFLAFPRILCPELPLVIPPAKTRGHVPHVSFTHLDSASWPF